MSIRDMTVQYIGETMFLGDDLERDVSFISGRDPNGALVSYWKIRLCEPIETSLNLSGTDCPAEKCSVCDELFEEGSRYCSNCGAKVMR